MAASRKSSSPTRLQLEMPQNSGRKTTKAVLPGAKGAKPSGPKPVRLTADQ
jgi:hypothetical protein